ncbi:hypothetical protein KAR91_83085 [Candidatus Pacearchaeota archaeon]|nr:hypothetical protein [Candidatus Pacearchaeota archaeon]
MTKPTNLALNVKSREMLEKWKKITGISFAKLVDLAVANTWGDKEDPEIISLTDFLNKIKK